MRVDQVITIVWAGNIALLGGTGWVGWKFWEQKKLGSKAPVVAWPESAGKDVPLQGWPGPITGFKPIWDTQVNGLVPPPPPPPDTGPKTPVDIGEIFRRRISILSAMQGSDPASTYLKISDSGTEKMIGLGQRIDEWKLIGVAIDREKAAVRALFSNPNYEKSPLAIDQEVPPWKDPTKGGGFVAPPGEPPFSRDRVRRDYVDTQAYQDPATGEWNVPAEEMFWWSEWGTEEILAKTKFVARPEGLEVASQPPRAALDSMRGVVQGDVIVSINDVPVKTLDELLAYLRGPGSNKTRYAVVIETNGARHTTVYRVHRPRAN